MEGEVGVLKRGVYIFGQSGRGKSSYSCGRYLGRPFPKKGEIFGVQTISWGSQSDAGTGRDGGAEDNSEIGKRGSGEKNCV